MAGKDNLKPFRTVEEARINGTKGGIASGEARKKKKQLKELAEVILDNKIKNEAVIEDMKDKFPELNVEDVTYGLMLLLKQYEKAKDGDAKAFELLRDTSGQRPVEKQEVTNLDNNGYLRVVIDGLDISEDEIQ